MSSALLGQANATATFDVVDIGTVEDPATTYDGYAVNPQALDARIQAGVRGLLVFSGKPPARCEVLQERYPYGSTGLIGGIMQSVIGDRIRLAVYVDG